MNALARRAVSVVAACLLFAVVLPAAQAQPVPPPPSPPGIAPVTCPGPSFPVLDWVDDCTPSLLLAPWVFWAEDVVDWLRCDILGGAAC